MRRSLPFVALPFGVTALSVLLSAPAAAQLPDDPRLQEAYLAWDRGEYPAALQGYLDVLGGPDGESLLPVIARLTGEPFQVTEVAPDGRAIRMGPDGRYALYETTEGDRPVTRVVDVAADGRAVATLPGHDAILSADGRVLYATIEPTRDLVGAVEAEDRARASGDRSAFLEARRRTQWFAAQARRLHVRDLASGQDRALAIGGWITGEAVFAPDGSLFVVAAQSSKPGGNEILRIRGTEVEVLPTGEGFKASLRAAGDVLVFESPGTSPLPISLDAEPVGPSRVGVGIVDLATGQVRFHEGKSSPAVARDGSRVAFLGQADGEGTVEVAAPGDARSRVLLRTSMDLGNPAVSPSGTWVAYQKRPVHDQEIFAIEVDAGSEIQITREIQHDLLPSFLDDERLLAAKGEGRHRRSFVYRLADDPDNGLKIFHNNTVRTIAPEYEWEVAPDGRTVMVVSERDGDTVSPERGVYLVHLDRPVTRAQVRARLETALAEENDLRARAEETFAPIRDEVERVTERVDVGRIHEYARVLYAFDSKHITQPGNRLALEFIAATLRGWGYEPELQWFEPRPGIRTANVIARLAGTTDPELVYAVSSHFDSSQRGPGADDNSSGTTALLEAARVMKDHPRAATIEFAFFTGEEAGLLGSREYVRLAQAGGKRIVGALNNDMVGWAEDHRLDNTIRYSNPGIRDIQHGSAILFSDLITYDALYYKSTDAHAYYEAYGDIVGGIGSYPVLGNPHYHQSTDRLETVSQRLVAEVSRVTVATLMKLASSPSRLTGLRVTSQRSAPGGGVVAELSWRPAPEAEVTGYRVQWTDATGEVRVTGLEAGTTSVRLEGAEPGSTVGVAAVNRAGMEGWDRARIELGG